MQNSISERALPENRITAQDARELAKVRLRQGDGGNWEQCCELLARAYEEIRVQAGNNPIVVKYDWWDHDSINLLKSQLSSGDGFYVEFDPGTKGSLATLKLYY